MRFKLLRRRLTISAPRMAVRNAVPWPLRWAVVAIVLGFCAAIGLWAFEFGKSIAGLDSGAKEELTQLRQDVVRLREERDKAQSIVNTAVSLSTAEKAAQDKLAAQVRTLEAESQTLRDDLGFFERLIPSSGEAIAIRGLHAEVLPGGAQLKWQVLVIQPVKNAPEFRGRMEITLAGTLAGKPWSMPLPGGAQAVQLRQYRRLEGLIDLPASAVVKNVSARVLEGTATRAAQSIPL